MEGALEFSHEDVHEAVFGQMPRLFGVLVINHHFLLPAQLHLHKGQMAKNEVWILGCGTIDSTRKHASKKWNSERASRELLWGKSH